MIFIINIILFIIYGGIYVIFDYFHWKFKVKKELLSVFFCDGLAGVLIGLLNEFNPEMTISMQVLIGVLMTLCIEFIVGCILNLWLKLDIWNYNKVTRYHIMGQVAPIFTINWIPIIWIVIYIDDILRNLFLMIGIGQ